MPKKADSTSCCININLFSGRREPLQVKSTVLLTVLDGYQKLMHRKDHKASSIRIEGIPFRNNLADHCTVIAAMSGHQQAGFTPVKVSPQMPSTVDLMLLPNDAGFDFREALWDAIKIRDGYGRVLRAGAASDAVACDRYTQVLENRPQALACLLNILTAMGQIQLPSGTPVDYLRELIWDETMEQDRFFGWTDAELVQQVARSAEEGLFDPEPGSLAFHPGATSSYKQRQFGEANVQITFHEKDKRTISGVRCVKAEFDMDYYKDRAAHALLEVLYHRLTGSATDPRQVYVLRWIAGRHAGVPEFNPPYRLA